MIKNCVLNENRFLSRVQKKKKRGNGSKSTIWNNNENV